MKKRRKKEKKMVELINFYDFAFFHQSIDLLHVPKRRAKAKEMGKVIKDDS